MDIKADLQEAIQLQQSGNLDPAERTYRRILKTAPENPDALHFLGLLQFQRGEHEQAVELIRRSIAILPAQAGAHSNLGNILKTLGREEEALESYLAAIGIDETMIEGWCNVGVLMRNSGRHREAMEVLEHAVELDPSHGESWHNLGLCYLTESRLEKAADAFQKCYETDAKSGWIDPNWHARVLCALGRRDLAIAILEQHLEYRPEDGVSRHLIAAIRGEAPERASDDYIRRHFDSFAGSFDAVLERLQYQAPALIAAWVDRFSSGKGKIPDVVDLGCGTGLSGALIRKRCGRLTGVDLSPGMLTRASRGGCYDYLVEGELTAFLNEAPEACFDLAISADTLCYFGALDGVFSGVRRALKPGGWFIATVERSDGDAFAIDETGRFKHGEQYLRDTASAAGLNTVDIAPEVLRLELGQKIHGYVFALSKAPEQG